MEMDIKIGCAGWYYKDWVGSFYPKNLDPSKYLSYYSEYFDFTEVNSTFYSLPSLEMVDNWYKRVPNDFRFIVKVWKEITHKSNPEDLNYLIDEFFERLNALNEKINFYLFQFPPWFKYSEKHINHLKNIISLIPPRIKCVVELRDNSWFKDRILEEIKKDRRIFIGTSYLQGINPYYHANQTIYYIRLIGDRDLSSFSYIQRHKEKEINTIIKKVTELQKNGTLNEIFIIVNNHYTGFAPETANELKNKFGKSYRSFLSQKRLSDFI
ncbi:MAG: DUF72 domain-containing protein [Candidatus Lokiarchaeota archaeon]|nr:DUF72 domain-containing protein [Candidatus Lokiarchaeota archaeon]MBD3202371.1 DUF72 domain-containing protein [Candidatus Lokiarchaeota archaeon]